MNKRKNRIIAVFTVLTLFMLSGCAGYAKFVFESTDTNHYNIGSRMTVQKLLDNWRNYHVFYSGPSSHQADAIMFDIKEDDNTLLGNNWIEIMDEETFSSLVTWSIGSLKWGNLYKITGPGERFFGYIYFSDPGKYGVAKILNDKTLYVYVPRSYIEDGLHPHF